MNVIAGISDTTFSISSFQTSLDQAIRIAAPKKYGPKEMKKLRRDCEILIDRLNKNPALFQKFMTLALAGNIAGASKVVVELKLTEQDFESEGGGCFILLVACCLLCVAVAALLIDR